MPDATPEHGDLVLFEWSQSVLDSWATDPRKADWIAKFGNADFRRGVKLFWEFPHEAPNFMPREHYLLTNADARKAKDHKVLGVVRAVERRGVILKCLVALAGIDINAATSVSEISVVNVAVSSSNVGFLTTIASLNVGPFPVAATVVITVTGTWTIPGTRPSSTIAFGLNTVTTSIGANNVQISPVAAGDQGLMAVESTFTLAANTSQTYYLLGISLPGTGINSYTVTQATMKVEAIKR